MTDSGQPQDTTNNSSSSRSDIISRHAPASKLPSASSASRSGATHVPSRVPSHVSAQIPQPGDSSVSAAARGRQGRVSSTTINKVASQRASSSSVPSVPLHSTYDNPGDSKLPPLPGAKAPSSAPKPPIPQISKQSAPANTPAQPTKPASSEKPGAASPSQQTTPPAQSHPSTNVDKTKSGASADVGKNKSGDTNKDENQPSDNTIPVGTRIDEKYEILGTLGTGGFATVYRARHLMIDRDVALKVMDIQKGVDPSYKERFFREAKIASKIQHNNVVSIYDIGVISQTQQPYIAMEMLVGHDLSHELEKNGPLSPKRAYVLFRPVLDALAEGHRQGIVHKDLKPENLFLIDPGGPHESMKVLDFGVARIDSSEVAKLTSAGQLLGTPRYLAPEYIKSQLVTPAIDVYQMALILSEALIGIPAVSGDPYSAMMHHCQGDLRIADFLLEGEVGKVFCKAIALDNNERYQNCEEFAAALDTIEPYFESTIPIHGGDPQSTPERHVSSKVILQTGNIKPIVTASSLTAAVKAPKKKKAILPLIIIGVVALLGIIIVLAVAASKKAPTPTPAPIAQPAVNEAPQEPAKPATLTFNFETTPEGASVMLADIELCKTPCPYEFKKDETNKITFVLAGYEPFDATINETIYELKSGKISAELKQMSKPKITFTINVKPANVEARLYAADGIPRRCKTECKYEFDPNEATEETLTINASGYNEQTFIINENTEEEVNIELIKSPKRAVTKPTTPAPTTAPTQAPTAPAKPPQEQKPGFKFM